jgi:hypothetical protein
VAKAERGPDQEERAGARGQGRDGAAGDRSVFLARMHLVGLGIDDVVDGVDGAGEQAKTEASDQAPPQQGQVEGRLAEQERGQDENALHPLPGSKETYPVADGGERPAEGVVVRQGDLGHRVHPEGE